MSKIMNMVHGSGTRVMEIMTAPFRRLMAWMLSIYTIPLIMAPTLCAKINTGVNMDKLFGGMADIIIKIAFYVGAFLAIGGVFSLVLAYKDDNSEGQSRAIRLLVIAGVLIGLESFLKLAGILG